MLLSRQLGYIIPFHLAAAADAKYSDFLSAWLDLVVATTPPRRISKWEIFEYSSPFSRDLLPKDLIQWRVSHVVIATIAWISR